MAFQDSVRIERVEISSDLRSVRKCQTVNGVDRSCHLLCMNNGLGIFRSGSVAGRTQLSVLSRKSPSTFKRRRPLDVVSNQPHFPKLVQQARSIPTGRACPMKGNTSFLIPKRQLQLGNHRRHRNRPSSQNLPAPSAIHIETDRNGTGG